MIPAPLDVIHTPKQAWNLFREKYDLRLSEIVCEMTEQHQADVEKISSKCDKGRNVRNYLRDRIDVESKHANDWAEKCYQLCCDVWEEDGHQKCSAFYEAVFRYCLLPMFKGRESAVTGQLKRKANILGKTVTDDAIRIFAEDIACLRHEWKTRLDIEALGGRHRKVRERVIGVGHQTSAVPPIPPANVATSRSIPERRVRVLTKPEEDRKKGILGAIKNGLTGQRYCHRLDSLGLPIPARWAAEGCPVTHAAAYGIKKFKKRIQDEKCRVRKT